MSKNNNMRGADKFKKYYTIIAIFEKFFKALPKKFSDFIWNKIINWTSNVGMGLRYAILKAHCKKCSGVVMIGPYVEIRHMENLSIGSYVSINRGSYIDAFGGITINDYVEISHSCSLISFNHSIEEGKHRRDCPSIGKEIIIEKDVWIGAGSRIMAGVTIGELSIVGAGSVVTKNVESNSVVGGVPAKFIKCVV